MPPSLVYGKVRNMDVVALLLMAVGINAGGTDAQGAPVDTPGHADRHVDRRVEPAQATSRAPDLAAEPLGKQAATGWQPMPEDASRCEFLVEVDPLDLSRVQRGEMPPVQYEIPADLGPVGRVRFVAKSDQPLPRRRLVTLLKPVVDPSQEVRLTQFTTPRYGTGGSGASAPQSYPANAAAGAAAFDPYARTASQAVSQAAQQAAQQAGRQITQSAREGIRDVANSVPPPAQQLFGGENVGPTTDANLVRDFQQRSSQPIRDGIQRIDDRVGQMVENLGEKTRDVLGNLGRPLEQQSILQRGDNPAASQQAPGYAQADPSRQTLPPGWGAPPPATQFPAAQGGYQPGLPASVGQPYQPNSNPSQANSPGYQPPYSGSTPPAATSTDPWRGQAGAPSQTPGQPGAAAGYANQNPPPPGYQSPGYQPPGYQSPGYQSPGYQSPGYQSPGYQPPGYQPPASQMATNQPPGYQQQPGYQQPGYQQPGYQQPGNNPPGYPPPGYQWPEGRSNASPPGTFPSQQSPPGGYVPADSVAGTRPGERLDLPIRSEDVGRWEPVPRSTATIDDYRSLPGAAGTQRVPASGSGAELLVSRRPQGSLFDETAPSTEQNVPAIRSGMLNGPADAPLDANAVGSLDGPQLTGPTNLAGGSGQFPLPAFPPSSGGTGFNDVDATLRAGLEGVAGGASPAGYESPGDFWQTGTRQGAVVGQEGQDPRLGGGPASGGSAPGNVFAVLLAWVLLSGSAAGNLYLFWSYMDVRNKYRALVRKTARAVGSRMSVA
jgi:hypothetical protein